MSDDKPNIRIVMIDDSSLALEVQVMMFERRGYTVTGCTDMVGMRAAAAELNDAQKPPDIVVTDVGLADVTIEEAVVAIREAFGEDVPLLLFSGQEDDALEVLVEKLGVDGFINKSDHRNVVYEKVEAAVRLSKL